MVALNPIRKLDRIDLRTESSYEKKQFAHTYNREYDDPGEHGCEAVRQADHNGVTVTIVVHWIVRRKRYQTAKSQA